MASKHYTITIDITTNKVIDAEVKSEPLTEECAYKVDNAWVASVNGNDFSDAKERAHTLVSLIYVNDFEHIFI